MNGILTCWGQWTLATGDSEGVAAWKSSLGHASALHGLEMLMLSTLRCGTVGGTISSFCFYPCLWMELTICGMGSGQWSPILLSSSPCPVEWPTLAIPCACF